MAVVHLGLQLGPLGYRRPVVLKKLHAHHARDPEFVAMLLDEARLSARVRHPGLVPIVDVLAAGSDLTLVLEYVPGAPLSFLRSIAEKTGRPVPPALVSAIGAELSDVLHAVHEARDDRGRALGIVHRDVSPQNVLLALDGSVHLLDLGVAKAGWRAQTTRSGELKGKLGYMAPEQLTHGDVDRRADVFAAGVVLWELLAGKRLHANVESAQQALDALERGVPALTATDAAVQRVESVLRKALHAKPSQRFESAEEFGRCLESACAPAPKSALRAWVNQDAAELLDDYRGALQRLEEGTGKRGGSATFPGVADLQTQRAGADEPPSTSQRGMTTVARRPREDTVLRTAVLLAIVAVIAVGAWQLGARSRPVTPETPSVAAPQLPKLPPEPAPQPSEAPTEPRVAASTNLPPPPAATAAIAPPKRALAKTSTATPPTASAPAPAPTTPNCSPPYRVESDGVRVFKEECL